MSSTRRTINLRYKFEAHPEQYFSYRIQYDYEVDEEEVLNFIIDYLYREFFRKWNLARLKDDAKKAIKDIIDEYDLFDWFLQCLNDEIHEHFQAEASDAFYRED